MYRRFAEDNEDLGRFQHRSQEPLQSSHGIILNSGTTRDKEKLHASQDIDALVATTY